MDQAGDELQRLQDRIDELMTVLGPPARGSGHDPSRMAGAFLDALIDMLGLDLAGVRLGDPIGGSPVDVVRLAPAAGPGAGFPEIDHAVIRWPAGEPLTSPARVPSPTGEGHTTCSGASTDPNARRSSPSSCRPPVRRSCSAGRGAVPTG